MNILPVRFQMFDTINRHIMAQPTKSNGHNCGLFDSFVWRECGILNGLIHKKNMEELYIKQMNISCVKNDRFMSQRQKNMEAGTTHLLTPGTPKNQSPKAK